jgi:hypothetical protein
MNIQIDRMFINKNFKNIKLLKLDFMKRLYPLVMGAAFVLLSANYIQAQNMQTSLNQVELMKQFIGTWENKSIKDTVYTAEFKPYGNGGLEFSLRGVTQGKVWLEMKQLWGYDKKRDKVVIAGLMKSSANIILQSAFFTSKNKFEQVPFESANDPKQANFTVVFDIKSPDLIIREEFVNNKSLGTEKYIRVKD